VNLLPLNNASERATPIRFFIISVAPVSETDNLQQIQEDVDDVQEQLSGGENVIFRADLHTFSTDYQLDVNSQPHHEERRTQSAIHYVHDLHTRPKGYNDSSDSEEE